MRFPRLQPKCDGQMVGGDSERPQASSILRFFDHHWFGSIRFYNGLLSCRRGMALEAVLFKFVVVIPFSSVILAHRNSIVPLLFLTAQNLKL